jgi:hypothetical protein
MSKLEGINNKSLLLLSALKHTIFVSAGQPATRPAEPQTGTGAAT